MRNKNLKLSILKNIYTLFLFSLFSHLFITFSASIYFTSIQELNTLNIKRETIVNGFCIISILLLCVSLSKDWTWPIKIEEALIIVLLWVLLGNLLSKECFCCHNDKYDINIGPSAYSVDNTTTTTPTPTTEPEQYCYWGDYHGYVYSFLCLLTMLSSFLMDSKNYYISFVFTLFSMLSIVFILFIPVPCNQFNFMDVHIFIIKITLYNIVSFLNRYLRLSENLLICNYKTAISVLLSYDFKFLKSTDDFDKYHNYFFTPTLLFNKFDSLNKKILKNIKEREEEEGAEGDDRKERKKHNQLNNIIKLHRIYKKYNHDGWFNYLFSWKNRIHTNEYIIYIIDLARIIWILSICPSYLFLIAIEILIILYYIYRNMYELHLIEKIIKFIVYIK